MKRTKSAWTVENDGITLSMGGQVVATAIAPDGASIQEQRGNVALIAAAPRMFEILQEFIKYNGDYASSMPPDKWVESVQGIVADVFRSGLKRPSS